MLFEPIKKAQSKTDQISSDGALNLLIQLRSDGYFFLRLLGHDPYSYCSCENVDI